ncbi:nitroreductase family protein [Helicobacter sp.]
MEQDFMRAMRFRHACKKFDSQKPIAPEVFESILESGRLAPSSFGMEPTRLLVVRDRVKREQLKALCWNQDQITDASEVVVYLVKIADMQSTSNYALECFKRKGLSEEKIKAYKDERYANFLHENGYVDTQSIF